MARGKNVARYRAVQETTPAGWVKSIASGDLSDRFRSKSSSWDAFEKLASKAPATVPVARRGGCWPGLQAKVEVLEMVFCLMMLSRGVDEVVWVGEKEGKRGSAIDQWCRVLLGFR